MPLITKTFQFLTNAEGWTFTGEAGITGTFSNEDNAPGSTGGSLKTTVSVNAGVGSQNFIGAWTWTGTWESLGVPINNQVINVKALYQWKASTVTNSSTNIIGPLIIKPDTLIGSQSNFSSTSNWAAPSNSTINADILSNSNATIVLEFGVNFTAGVNNSLDSLVTTYLDLISLEITYKGKEFTQAIFI